MDLTVQAPSLVMFVHCEARTVCKRAVRTHLECFLVLFVDDERSALWSARECDQSAGLLPAPCGCSPRGPSGTLLRERRGCGYQDGDACVHTATLGLSEQQTVHAQGRAQVFVLLIPCSSLFVSGVTMTRRSLVCTRPLRSLPEGHGSLPRTTSQR